MIAIFSNEIVEELIVATTGKWGYSLDPPFDLEARYDTLIRDIVLSAGLGTWVGNRFNTYVETVEVFPSPLFDNDKFVIVKRLIALVMMERAQVLYYDKVYKDTFNIDAIYLLGAYVMIFLYIYFSCKDDILES